MEVPSSSTGAVCSPNLLACPAVKSPTSHFPATPAPAALGIGKLGQLGACRAAEAGMTPGIWEVTQPAPLWPGRSQFHAKYPLAISCSLFCWGSLRNNPGFISFISVKGFLWFPRGCAAGDFLLTETQEEVVRGLCWLNICAPVPLPVSNPARERPACFWGRETG